MADPAGFPEAETSKRSRSRAPGTAGQGGPSPKPSSRPASAARRSPPGPPRASRRSVFGVFVTALQEVDQLAEGVSYDQLPVFTQGWLKGRVTDHGNALRLMRFWGLVAPSGVLDREFVTRAARAGKTGDFGDFRSLLRSRFLRAYERLAAVRKQDFDFHALQELGRDDWDPGALELLPGIGDESDTQTNDKRRQCIAAVGDVIRYCDDRPYLAAEAGPKSFEAPAPGPSPSSDRRLKEVAAASLGSFAQVEHRRFNFRDQDHNNVAGQVWFDVPKTSYWIEQLGLRLLDWADQLRSQEEA